MTTITREIISQLDSGDCAWVFSQGIKFEEGIKISKTPITTLTAIDLIKMATNRRFFVRDIVYVVDACREFIVCVYAGDLLQYGIIYTIEL